MRSSFSLISLLIVVALIMVFFARKATHDVDAVRTVSLTLPQTADPKDLDVREANRMVVRLRELLSAPELPVAELKQISQQANSWVAGARPGTAAHHMAVQIRGAAVELLASSASLDDAHRIAARRYLDTAGSPELGGPGGGPANPIQGIRDQLQNLQSSQREQTQDSLKDTQ